MYIFWALYLNAPLLKLLLTAPVLPPSSTASTISCFPQTCPHSEPRVSTSFHTSAFPSGKPFPDLPANMTPSWLWQLWELFSHHHSSLVPMVPLLRVVQLGSIILQCPKCAPWSLTLSALVQSGATWVLMSESSSLPLLLDLRAVGCTSHPSCCPTAELSPLATGTVVINYEEQSALTPHFSQSFSAFTMHSHS